MGWPFTRTPRRRTSLQLNGEAPLTIEALAATVHSLTMAMKRQHAWDDRMGSAVRRLWHQLLVIVLLCGIVGLLVWGQVRVKPEILPYLYVVDPAGAVLWQGVPGTYDIKDAFVLNHLEDWVTDVRSRPDDPTLLVLWKGWTRADQFTVQGSECYERLQAYMRETDPRKLSRQPRIEVRVQTKKVLARQPEVHEYRLGWQEVELGRTGQIVRSSAWEGDFTVVLDVPKTVLQAQQTNRYGVLLSRCSWAEKAHLGG